MDGGWNRCLGLNINLSDRLNFSEISSVAELKFISKSVVIISHWRYIWLVYYLTRSHNVLSGFSSWNFRHSHYRYGNLHLLMIIVNVFQGFEVNRRFVYVDMIIIKYSNLFMDRTISNHIIRDNNWGFGAMDEGYWLSLNSNSWWLVNYNNWLLLNHNNWLLLNNNDIWFIVLFIFILFSIVAQRCQLVSKLWTCTIVLALMFLMGLSCEWNCRSCSCKGVFTKVNQVTIEEIAWCQNEEANP